MAPLDFVRGVFVCVGDWIVTKVFSDQHREVPLIYYEVLEEGVHYVAMVALAILGAN